ncbi:MAG: hypothetical protein NDJ90_12600 [Oligoflexia bacterium]|nr:hypothetical protein [Oligoflexia bacterium]
MSQLLAPLVAARLQARYDPLPVFRRPILAELELSHQFCHPQLKTDNRTRKVMLGLQTMN